MPDKGKRMNICERLFSLKGKSALVTGGASGIGFMIASALVEAGADVMIASRKADDCQKAAEAINELAQRSNSGGSATGFGGNVATRDGVLALAGEVKSRTDALHILFNNAGTTGGEPVDTFPYEAWGRVLDVNVTGLFNLTRELLPLLEKAATRQDPSRVVNVGSVMGEIPLGDGAYSYAASKAATLHLTKILAKELAGQHITVNALAPGPFVSKMTAFATGDPAKRAKVGADVPLGRVGREEDIAGCVLFLCGRGGSYVTGAVIPVSGGINVQTGGNIFAGGLE